jgi:hypothetical protein
LLLHGVQSRNTSGKIFSTVNAPNKGLSTGLVFSSTLQYPVTTALSTGEYLVRYQVREECCGWSIPVFERIFVVDQPTNPLDFTFSSPASGTDVCLPSTITAVSPPTGVTGGITPYEFDWDYENSVRPYGTTLSSAPSFAAVAGDNKVKVRVAENELKGCLASTILKR